MKKLVRSLICCQALFLSYSSYSQSEVKYRIVAVRNDSVQTSSTSNHVVIQKESSIFIPSAFTPNRDGVNDFFEIQGEGIDQIELTIFNRWGELIFESKSLDNRWDGTYNNQPVPSGVYVYKVLLKNNSKNKWIEKEGRITVLL